MFEFVSEVQENISDAKALARAIFIAVDSIPYEEEALPKIENSLALVRVLEKCLEAFEKFVDETDIK